MGDLDRRSALRWGSAALAGGLVASLAACSEDPNSVAGQARAGDRKNYVSGDGTIERLAPGNRGPAVRLAGTTLEGEPWSIEGTAGAVLVVNVWGSWCPPCIEETPDLQKAWEQVQADGLEVEFIGLDKMESPETGLAFQKANRVTYPSLAYDGGLPILALQGKATATPSTLVLDRVGRIAARVSGPVTTSTLRALVDDVLAEA
ncbi:TlpA family protein disulfide reductase [Intrasporangium calvum]|uniref:Redoxin domain protein n=1 Tax=Intrasporangium calvum (strain ATCC 23552 / DSM 43043 / JCM 3097 / NBRC 12989 / NCIMB 10167 / NRRL B-3866 / 7 KIP) TaxID=710696 RepID=E6SAG0_INTC7|nr:TlpA disulfide reductase family protein [Intrasporangium calvum]ADU47210.1 Redoxin domain protein [Intrasporangium calvum DSM 43043]